MLGRRRGKPPSLSSDGGVLRLDGVACWEGERAHKGRMEAREAEQPWPAVDRASAASGERGVASPLSSGLERSSERRCTAVEAAHSRSGRGPPVGCPLSSAEPGTTRPAATPSSSAAVGRASWPTVPGQPSRGAQSHGSPTARSRTPITTGALADWSKTTSRWLRRRSTAEHPGLSASASRLRKGSESRVPERDLERSRGPWLPPVIVSPCPSRVTSSKTKGPRRNNLYLRHGAGIA